MKSLVELNKIINKKRDVLNLSIKNDEPQDVIYKKSVDVDEAISEYIKAQDYFKIERENILALYKNIIDTPFKNNIINQIKSDILIKYVNITEKELNHFSSNIYIYTVLMNKNIDKVKIVEVINRLNNLYVEEWQEDGIVKDNVINETNLDYYKSLNKKYLKIVKGKLK